MSTLLLRLAGPLQSWGTQSRFTIREAGMEPSKSGVVGLLCAADGRPRDVPVDDLAALRMGVRVDRQGSLSVDYHTAGGAHKRGEAFGVAKANGNAPDPVVSRRFYLADADFLVGLQGEDEGLLRRLHRALQTPTWQICLGRKSFVPGVPVWLPDGLRLGQTLEVALATYPWPRPDLPVPPPGRRPVCLRLVLEDPGGVEVRRDQPYGAAFQQRTFTTRLFRTDFVELGTRVPVREETPCISPA
ncbi:MAG: type I-E CRISPR-associated protein Cas5/CasD [Chloroflexota bacterium]